MKTRTLAPTEKIKCGSDLFWIEGPSKGREPVRCLDATHFEASDGAVIEYRETIFSEYGWITHPWLSCSVSPSQIDTFISCQRKWGFEKLLNIRSGSAATELGTAVHAERERWLRDGTPIDLTTKAGQIAIEGLEHLPPPETAEVEAHLEKWLRLPSPELGGLAWRGIADLIYGKHLDDHKTWGGRFPHKTAADLILDAQANFYAAILFDRGLDFVKCTWHYLRTQKPYRCTPERFKIYRDDPIHRAAVDLLVSISYAIEAARRAPPGDVNSLPYDVRSCGNFGGCPHKKTDRCVLPETDRFAAYF